LTPDDIAEVVVFAAGRRENVVLADSLIFPNHQVRISYLLSSMRLTRAGCCYCYAQEVWTDKIVGWDCGSDVQEAVIGRNMIIQYRNK
jgi:hypothetical protein